MRRILIAAVIAGLLASGFASDARRNALGPGALYIPDPAGIVFLPAMAVEFPNMAVLEMGTYMGDGVVPSGQWGFFNFGISDNFVLGGALRRADGEIFSRAPAFGYNAPNPGLNLWGAYKMGKIKFGLGFYAASYSDDTKDENSNTESKYNSHIYSFRLATIVGLGDEGRVQFGLNTDLNGFSSENTNSSNQTYTDKMTGGLGLTLFLRGFIPFGDNLKLAPVIRFHTFSHSREINDYSGNTTDYGDYSSMEMFIGNGFNFNVMDDGLLSFGLGMRLADTKNEIDTANKVEDKTFVLPAITLAGEIPLKSWLTARFGVSKNFGTLTHTEGGVEDKESFSESEGTFASVGAGIKAGNFFADFTLSDDDLFEGPWFLSGHTIGAVTLSLGYKWE